MFILDLLRRFGFFTRLFCGRLILLIKVENGLSHFLAGLEFNDRSRRDADIHLRRIGVSANARFPDLDLEDPEITQFDRLSLRDRVGNIVKGLLHDLQDLLLNQTGLVADPNY